MLPIVWRATARSDLRQIVTYIARENPLAAEYENPAGSRCATGIRTPLPLSTKRARFRPTRDCGPSNYIVLYQVTASRIEIVNVVHARRQFPEQI